MCSWIFHYFKCFFPPLKVMKYYRPKCCNERYNISGCSSCTWEWDHIKKRRYEKVKVRWIFIKIFFPRNFKCVLYFRMIQIREFKINVIAKIKLLKIKEKIITKCYTIFAILNAILRFSFQHIWKCWEKFYVFTEFNFRGLCFKSWNVEIIYWKCIGIITKKYSIYLRIGFLFMLHPHVTFAYWFLIQHLQKKIG